MNKLLFFLGLCLLLLITISSCKLDNGNLYTETATLELTGWNLPEESKVETPFNLVLSARTETSCFGKINFVLEVVEGKNYVYAKSFYRETEDGCDELVVTKDSTMSITLNEVGKYYYYFPKNNKWNKDSIQIVR